jgi:hypothetical protein
MGIPFKGLAADLQRKLSRAGLRVRLKVGEGKAEAGARVSDPQQAGA